MLRSDGVNDNDTPERARARASNLSSAQREYDGPVMSLGAGAGVVHARYSAAPSKRRTRARWLAHCRREPACARNDTQNVVAHGARQLSSSSVSMSPLGASTLPLALRALLKAASSTSLMVVFPAHAFARSSRSSFSMSASASVISRLAASTFERTSASG